MFYEMCAQTHPGLRRDNNEDALAFDAASGLCVLADGMGGYNAGEVASGMATNLIMSLYGNWLRAEGASASAETQGDKLVACIRSANQSILATARSNRAYEGMGTTLVVAHFHGNGLLLAHLGDSRCYRLRRAELCRLTKDHSVLQSQVDAGRVSPQQALHWPGRNLITRALGAENHVVPEMHQHEVQADDLYLLCSDGLTDMLSDETIAGCLLASGKLDERALRLIKAANLAGGADNISVLLVHAAASAPASGDSSPDAGELAAPVYRLLRKMLGK